MNAEYIKSNDEIHGGFITVNTSVGQFEGELSEPTDIDDYWLGLEVEGISYDVNIYKHEDEYKAVLYKVTTGCYTNDPIETCVIVFRWPHLTEQKS